MDGEGEQRDVFPAQAKARQSDEQPDGSCYDGRGGKPGDRRQSGVQSQHGGCIGAGRKEDELPIIEDAGVAEDQVPRRGDDAPQEAEDQNVPHVAVGDERSRRRECADSDDVKEKDALQAVPVAACRNRRRFRRSDHPSTSDRVPPMRPCGRIISTTSSVRSQIGIVQLAPML